MKAKTYVMTAAVSLFVAAVGCGAKELAKEKPTERPIEARKIAVGQEPTEHAGKFKSEPDKISYVIGTQMGQSLMKFKAEGVEINLDIFIIGLKDVLAGRELALKPQEIRQTMMDFQQKMMAKQQQLQAKQAEKNIAESKVFLEQNKTKAGVKVLASGLQYKVLKEGTGRKPAASDRVKTHYRGTLINGQEFDSSYKRGQPAEFPVKGVIAGWTEALQLMKEGAKWRLFIPPDLAYGKRGRPSIPPNSALIFEVELLEVVGQNTDQPGG